MGSVMNNNPFVMDEMWNSDEEGGEYYDEIMEEEEFKYDERQDGKYYIGLPFYDKVFEELLLASSVHGDTFFSHSIENVTHYLKNYSVVRTEKRDIPEIMQLYIDPTTEAYNVVLKTHWLRLVQRTWKNVMRKRKACLQEWSNPTFLKQREVQCINTQTLPGLRGMMATYLKVSK